MITQTCHCNAAPKDVFAAYLSSEEFEAITTMPAQIESRAGGACSLFGGMIEARNIEIIEGQRLVQVWRPKHWDPGVYSVVRFDFAAKDAGTEISLTHTGYPDGAEEHLTSGWEDRYWAPLRAHFG